MELEIYEDEKKKSKNWLNIPILCTPPVTPFSHSGNKAPLDLIG